MAAERQPTRPVTKIPRNSPPAAAPAPPRTGRRGGRPASSPPATRPVPTVPQPRLAPPPPPNQPPARPERKTGRVERHLTSRSVPTTSGPPNPVFLVGGILGVFFLAVLIVAVAASSSSGRRNRSVEEPKGGAPQGPSVIEQEALVKCEEGRALIQRSYDIGDRAGLQKGMNLIIEGNTALERVNQMTGKKFDTRPYNEALKMARVKLGELK